MKVARSLFVSALAGAVIMTASTAGAQTAPLGLKEAVAFALAHSTPVTQSAAALASADNALARQKAITYPTVGGQVQSFIQKSSNYGGGYAVVGLQQQTITSQNTASIQSQYNLNVGGLAFVQLAQSQAQDDAAKATLKRAQDEVAQTVTTAYYAIAQKQALIAVDKSDADYQHVLVLNAQAKERAGIAAGVDVLRAQVTEAQSRSNLLAAQSDAQDSSESLAQSIGAPVDTLFTFASDINQPALPNGTVDSLVQIAQNSRPDVAAAKLSLRNANLQRKTFDRELFPTINLSAGLGNQFSPTTAVLEQEQIDQQFALNNQNLINQHLPPIPLSQKPIVTRGSPGYWQVQAVTTFTLPFIDYGSRHTERSSDDAQVAQAESALTAAQGQAELDVRQSYRAAQTAQAQLQYATDETRLGKEAARIAQIQYSNGIIALSDVVQAEQTSVQAQSDLIAARVAYVNAVVRLRVALGTYDATSAVADLR